MRRCQTLVEIVFAGEAVDDTDDFLDDPALPAGRDFAHPDDTRPPSRTAGLDAGFGRVNVGFLDEEVAEPFAGILDRQPRPGSVTSLDRRPGDRVYRR